MEVQFAGMCRLKLKRLKIDHEVVQAEMIERQVDKKLRPPTSNGTGLRRCQLCSGDALPGTNSLILPSDQGGRKWATKTVSTDMLPENSDPR
jgi:hypothetical protein